MLNRRTLRIKAMQTLYAWYRTRVSNLQLMQDFIREDFNPVLLAKDEVLDKDVLKAQEQEANRLFAEMAENPEQTLPETTEPIVRDSVLSALNRYREMMQHDRKFLRKQMLSEADKIHHHYIMLLLLFQEFAQQNLINHEERQDKAKRQNKVLAMPSLNLHHNQVIKRLAEHPQVEQLAAKYGVNWYQEGDQLRSWYRELVKDEPAMQEYFKLEAPTFEEDRQAVMTLIKEILFKKENIMEYWETHDLSWEEDRDVLKSMLRKTIKGIPEDGGAFELIDLSPNWEDDRQFFEDLFDVTMKEDEYTDEVIAERTKNWDFDRLAATDKIILKMAVSEMLNFPSVPVKVTINEYIEISKQYSTPKSKQFVNGMLDVIADALTKDGQIRKSGRGLIDNK